MSVHEQTETEVETEIETETKVAEDEDGLRSFCEAEQLRLREQIEALQLDLARRRAALDVRRTRIADARKRFLDGATSPANIYSERSNMGSLATSSSTADTESSSTTTLPFGNVARQNHSSTLSDPVETPKHTEHSNDTVNKLDPGKALRNSQTRLVHQLRYYFPIRHQEIQQPSESSLMSFSTSGKKVRGAEWTICDHALPSQTAWAQTVLLTLCLSYILHQPLPYPLTFMGSQSTIQDPISYITGSTTFMLGSPGQPAVRAKYASWLMNKNVEVLMKSIDADFQESEGLLPNLLLLLIALDDPACASSSMVAADETDDMDYLDPQADRSERTTHDSSSVSSMLQRLIVGSGSSFPHTPSRPRDSAHQSSVLPANDPPPSMEPERTEAGDGDPDRTNQSWGRRLLGY